MRIEDIELGEKYYHTCEGCKYSCQSVEHVNCKTKIISVGDEMVVHKREGRKEISCPASQFTPIEAGDKGDEKSQDDVLQVLCIMCGRSVPVAHEKAHRESMDCIQARKHDPIAVDTWKCHCGMTGRYIDLQEPFTGCHHCGGEVQDS